MRPPSRIVVPGLVLVSTSVAVALVYSIMAGLNGLIPQRDASLVSACLSSYFC